jgi:zinc protease
MKRAASVLLAALFAFGAPAQVETTAPPPAPPREVRIPQPAEQTLPNGLRVIVIPKHNVPIVAARLVIATGAEADPADRWGLADMTGSLLTKGTTGRTSRQVAEAIESLGTSIDAGAGWDQSYAETSVMSSKLEKALAIMADVVLHPSFTQSELKLLRDQNIDSLKVAMQEPRSVRNMVLNRVIFGDAPYGHPAGGIPDSLLKITRDDVVRFHTAHYRPDNAILALAGDVEPEAAFALAKKLFGNWGRGGTTAPATATSVGNHAPVLTTGPPKPRIVVIDMPEAGQAAVAVARIGIRRVDPGYYVSEVANMVLGGNYSSRLNKEIRIERGLSYGAGSSFEVRREPGTFMATAQTKNESAVEVTSLILDQLTRLGREPVGPAELGARKANLIGSFSRSLETNGVLVGRAARLALLGLDLDVIGKYTGSIEGVTAADVQSFTTSHLDAPSVVIVGNASKFREELVRRWPAAEVIEIGALDLRK